MNKKIGLIGLGNIGGAIYSQLAKKYSSDLLYVCGHHQNRAKELGVKNFSLQAEEVVAQVDIVILAIKPQSFFNWPAMPSLAGKLVISVMAGVSMDKLNKMTKSDKIVRAMPNLGAQVGQGVIGWLASNKVGREDKGLIRRIIASLGMDIELDDEDKINAITALSGSGPAYFYYFCELLTDKAVKMGFSQEQARQIAEQTFIGSAKLLERESKSGRELRQAVTSKGGTTRAALEILMKEKFKGILFKAVDAAYKQAQKLNK